MGPNIKILSWLLPIYKKNQFLYQHYFVSIATSSFQLKKLLYF